MVKLKVLDNLKLIKTDNLLENTILIIKRIMGNNLTKKIIAYWVYTSAYTSPINYVLLLY